MGRSRKPLWSFGPPRVRIPPSPLTKRKSGAWFKGVSRRPCRLTKLQRQIKSMKPNRLEAFGDGVIEIIITIMVLEVRVEAMRREKANG